MTGPGLHPSRWATLAVSVGMVVLAACAAPPASPSASTATAQPAVIVSSSPSPLPSQQPTPSATAPPTPTPEPVPASWATADPMPEGLDLPQAVKLADGRVLVVGQRSRKPANEMARPVATIALLSDPTTGKWHRAGGLGELRANYALVALQDGRALVIGGNGATGKALDTTMAFDPTTRVWSKAAKMSTPRAVAAAALLADGRVLVTGGHTALKSDLPGGRTEPATALAAYHPPPSGAPSQPPLADIIPNTKVKALATAELFDPTTGTWSPTGPMRFPRSGALATTLSDGRVLVVGSVSQEGFPIWPDDRALTTAELYDPTAGTFTSAGKLPAVPKVRGVDRDLLDGQPWQAGTLVALPEGDAALVGRMTSEYNTSGVTRSFRFDSAGSSWSEIGEPWIKVSIDGTDAIQVADGPDIGGAAVVALADGRVLVAGGGASQPQMDSPLLATARIYDPATDRWMKGPKLPKARTMATAVRLDDGSVLVFGGYARRYWWDSPPLQTALRFVPER